MVRVQVCGAVLAGVLFLGAGTSAATPDSPVPTPAPTPVPTSAPLPGPLLVIDHDGLYAVGTVILPGVYTSAGPAQGTKCYWKRVGSGDAILDNALTSQAQVVQIEPTDIAFKTRGCQPWQLTDGVVPPGQNPPWLSQLQLRHQLDVLNGLAGQSGNGQLPPY